MKKKAIALAVFLFCFDFCMQYGSVPALLFGCDRFSEKVLQEKLVHDATPYLLPSRHSLKPIMDSLFSSRSVIQDEASLTRAGFKTFRAQKTSGIRLITHPRLKGYIIKLYLDSQEHHRKAYCQQDWLIQRCRGAARLRELIRKYHFDRFVVPDKWLYEVPSQLEGEHTYVLIATKINIVDHKATRKAWRNNVRKRDLRALFMLMKNGGASGALVLNTPYTKSGKFAFIDTEYPDRIFSREKLEKVAKFFSSENQKYWIELIEKNENGSTC